MGRAKREKWRRLDAEGGLSGGMAMPRRGSLIGGTPIPRRGGFTLIEVLVVMAIIVILVAGVVTVGLSVRQSAQRKSTALTLSMLDGMRKEYENIVGKPPQVGTGFWNDFMAYPEYRKKLMGLGNAGFDPSRGVLDGFGNPVTFTLTPREGFQSNGPDGQPNTADDIYSWDPR